MKYMKFVLAALVAAALTTTAFAATNAAPVALTPASNLGNWTFSLSGGGSSDLSGGNLNSSAVGGEFELGHSGRFVLPLNAGVRQAVGYSDANGSSWLLGTRVYSDWTLIKLGNLQFDAGVNGGLDYGNRPLHWSVAPEVVGRIYLTKTVDLNGRVEAPFSLDGGKASFENTLVYKVGIRVRF
jgi:opacity protein-like surface antigen